MTREEFSKLVKGMKAVYADPKFIADKDAFDIWYSMLSDIPYEKASVGVQSYMLTNKFPPTIADIRGFCVDKSEELNPNEAWAMVYKALCNSTYNSRAEFDALPEKVQKAVGSPDILRNMASDMNFNEGVEKSLFTKTYISVCKRAEEDARLPMSIKNLIAESSTKMLGVSDEE